MSVLPLPMPRASSRHIRDSREAWRRRCVLILNTRRLRCRRIRSATTPITRLNSLQVRVQKRYTNGISLLISYTVSKDLTDADGQGGGAFLGSAHDYYNLRLEKAVAAADVPQAFVAAYSFDLPIGEKKRFKTGSKIIDKFVLGGWTTSGIVTLQSGTPLGVTTELSLPGMGSIRPNVAGTQLFSHKDRSSFDPGANLYLNPAAFVAPTPFTFGNAPRLFSQARAFGTREWDAALQKSIPIHETLRFSLKGEFFNVPNNVNWGAPVTDINNPSFGRINSAGSSRNGQISGTIYW
jgi:hypothetical protein